MSSCRSCHKPVIWVVVAESRRRMPLDATPTPDGQVVLDGPHGTARALKKGEAAVGLRYTPHHATCPDGPAWRGQGRDRSASAPGAPPTTAELERRANSGDARAQAALPPPPPRVRGAAAAAGYSATTLRVWTCPGCGQLRSGPVCKDCREKRPT